jgi:hypothetical protein
MKAAEYVAAREALGWTHAEIAETSRHCPTHALPPRQRRGAHS